MEGGIEYVDLGTDDPSVLGIKASGKVTGEAMSGLIDRLESIHASGRKARLYADLTNYEGYELAVVREKLTHFRTLWKAIERCAYVVDAEWMAKAIGLVDAVTPMHLRAFGKDQDAEARSWVLEVP